MNRPFRSLALAGAIVALLPTACSAQPPSTPIAPPPAATPAPPLVSGLPDFTALVQRVGPAVVNIRAEVAPRRARGGMPDADIPEIFRRFFGDDLPFPGPMPPGPGGGGVSLGSGFLISDDGYVLTNHHVVEGADKVKVLLSDRREFEAKVIGTDEQSDVALLKIDAKGLPFLRAARADSTKPGQWVIAIGSPFGLDHSVTAGIVSAVGRSNPYANQQYVPFIQTDVAINRGNSGGPLLNTGGEVVGINSQIFSNSGGYMGVSFAIPIDVAMNAAEQLRAKGRVSRGMLGVTVEQIDGQKARGFGLPDTRGALVNQVAPGSAADKAGLEPGDVIRAVDGRPVDTNADLPPLIGGKAPGTQVRLSVFRNGRTIEVPVVLDELEGGAVATAADGADQPARGGAAAPANPFGLALQDLSAEQRQRLNLRRDEGVLVAGVRGDAAAEAGLRPGDVVLSVGRKSVGSAAALGRELAAAKPGDTVMLLIRRGNLTQYKAVTVPERD
ncbi:DegQ family serine endoprotease [Vulcaniibacterium tengchongense]|uniref:Probable periplasmic serine endoprotease DegP-like n=1 Tax=Vulcaniibacterium tengchongense TaxID=1273429 RepID=A0A3N4W7R7_9GAMM|nr:DegQ family serine endoprotease [Vulcaniibacterium tengchongense]RPE81274.1 serine protease Do [Vulcaniibacterium tengchongense]